MSKFVIAMAALLITVGWLGWLIQRDVGFEPYPDCVQMHYTAYTDQVFKHPPFTEKTILITTDNEQDMQYETVVVPSLSNKTPYVCFRTKNARLVQCLYIDTLDKMVDQRNVLLLKEHI